MKQFLGVDLTKEPPEEYKCVFIGQMPDNPADWVMRKEDGSFVVGTEDSYHRIIPYTISVRYLTKNGWSKLYHFIAEEGEFEEGAVYSTNEDSSDMVRVVEVDTHYEEAEKRFVTTGRWIAQ